MKALILIAMLLGSTVNAFDVPKDAVIKVFDKSGKEIGRMSRDAYKVVKLEPSVKKGVPEVIIVNVVSDAGLKEQAYSARNNSVIIHAGFGKNGLQTSKNGVGYLVEEKTTTPVFGVSLCHTERKVGFCATGITNETFLLGFKKDF